MDRLQDKKRRELKKLTSMRDDEIDTSDVPERTDWSGAEVGKFFRPQRQRTTLEIDADLLDWFDAHRGRAKDRGEAINAALRAHVLSKQRRGRKTSRA